jgi:hypothetical protein
VRAGTARHDGTSKTVSMTTNADDPAVIAGIDLVRWELSLISNG